MINFKTNLLLFVIISYNIPIARKYSTLHIIKFTYIILTFSPIYKTINCKNLTMECITHKYLKHKYFISMIDNNFLHHVVHCQTLQIFHFHINFYE